MSKPIAGTDYGTLENGVIRVCRGPLFPTDDSGDKVAIPDYLDLVDHSLCIPKKKKYKKRLAEQEELFNELARKLKAGGKFLLTVFQGRDGAGKSGAARRIWEATHFDPKMVRWIPIFAPTDEELAHPYMWRFFRNDYMPRFGEVRIFDRSWAERLLVEPVEKIINAETLHRSYAEIRTFEWMLGRMGAVTVKFWLDITKDEQLKRFEERAKNRPEKLGPDDKKARAKWDDYTEAANAMFHLTGSPSAPWYVISSEDKWYSRVSVLETINSAMSQALGCEKKK